jgi:hypothetical protein
MKVKIPIKSGYTIFDTKNIPIKPEIRIGKHPYNRITVVDDYGRKIILATHKLDKYYHSGYGVVDFADVAKFSDRTDIVNYLEGKYKYTEKKDDIPEELKIKKERVDSISTPQPKCLEYDWLDNIVIVLLLLLAVYLLGERNK